ncbi:cereblon family protein [Desulfobacula sp.]|uniref:cereblon family protein n=1 Tax=Desulfobacula sp. TaxID=2593537 RepID=UPI002611D331|nr:cereblon family protein [Desulfobacula sp.]
MEVICKQSPLRGARDQDQPQTVLREEAVILCADCRHPITDPSKQILVNDAFRHIFANLHGYVFEIGCFSNARGCRSSSIPSPEFSWFPGFSWQIGTCQYCSTHLGWIFSSDIKQFYGLILEKLIFP